MNDRDLKPENVIRDPAPYLGRRHSRSAGEDDARLEAGELRHDEGEDRRGRWGLRG